MGYLFPTIFQALARPQSLETGQIGMAWTASKSVLPTLPVMSCRIIQPQKTQAVGSPPQETRMAKAIKRQEMLLVTHRGVFRGHGTSVQREKVICARLARRIRQSCAYV